MASISSVGVGSGVLNNQLIDDLIAAEREPMDKRLVRDETTLTTKVSELGRVSGAVSSLKSAMSSLTLASSFETNTTSSSDSNVLTATASSLAKPGVYNVETLQLARSQSIATKTYTDLNDIVGEGTLTFTFGDVDTTVDANKAVTSFDSFTADDSRSTKSINITSANHTLSQVRDEINKANMGVSASIVDTGNGYRLLLESDKTGNENGFTIETSNVTNGLDDFNFNAADNDQVLHTTEGLDSKIKVNGLEIDRDSNQITGVINGITLNLKQASVGEPSTLTIAADVSTINDRMQSFVDAYNELKTMTNELTAYDAEKNEGSVFTGDATIRGLDTQLKRLLSASVPATAGGTVNSLADAGLTSDRTTGLLSFDSGKFQNLIKTDSSAITKLFGTTGVGANNVEYVRGNNETKSGDYKIVVQELATQAEYKGNATAGGSYIIDALNDAFRVKLDGVLSAEIEITQGTYTGEELAAQLEIQINGDENLKKNANSVSVEFDNSNNSFKLTSATYGSESSVSFSAIDDNMADTLGLYKPGQGARTVGDVSALATNTNFSTPLTIDANNDTFKLDVAGISSSDINIAQGSYTDGASLALAMQSAINSDTALAAASLSSTVSFDADQAGGKFTIKFNNDETYSISGAEAGMSTLGIAVNVSSTSSSTALKLDDEFATAVTVDNSNDNFGVRVDGARYDDIQIPAGSYTDGASLASAVETAINAKTILGTPAKTLGAFNLSTPVDFSTNNHSFTMAVNGSAETEVLINLDATTDLDGSGIVDEDDNVFAIQAALDTAFGAGIITASSNNSTLALETLLKGAGASIDRSPTATTGTHISFGVGTENGTDGVTATVSYDGGNGGGGLRIDFGNSASFRLSDADSAMASTLGIKSSDGSATQVAKGTDVVGTINGVFGVGSGQSLVGAEGTDAYGLELKVDGDALGKRGTVNFNLGVAEQAERFLTILLSEGGALSDKSSGFQTSLETITNDKAELESRMDVRRSALSRQFSYYDILVAQLNSSADFLKANFDALNAQNN